MSADTFPLPREGQVVRFKGKDHLDKVGKESQRAAVFEKGLFLYKDEAFLPEEVHWWVDQITGAKYINNTKKQGYRTRASTMEQKARNNANSKRWRAENPEKYRAQLDRQILRRKMKKAAKAAGTA